jgi:hypothetical protein
LKVVNNNNNKHIVCAFVSYVVTSTGSTAAAAAERWEVSEQDDESEVGSWPLLRLRVLVLKKGQRAQLTHTEKLAHFAVFFFFFFFFFLTFFL